MKFRIKEVIGGYESQVAFKMFWFLWSDWHTIMVDHGTIYCFPGFKSLSKNKANAVVDEARLILTDCEKRGFEPSTALVFDDFKITSSRVISGNGNGSHYSRVPGGS